MAEIVRRKSWGGVLPLGRHASISGSRPIHAPSVSIAPPPIRRSKTPVITTGSMLALRLTHIPAGVTWTYSSVLTREARGIVMPDARHQDRHDHASYRRLELITGSKRRRVGSAREKAVSVAEAFA